MGNVKFTINLIMFLPSTHSMFFFQMQIYIFLLLLIKPVARMAIGRQLKGTHYNKVDLNTS